MLPLRMHMVSSLSILCRFSLAHFEIMSSKKYSNFPKTLEEFGYKFNSDGRLRKVDPKTGEPGKETFEFNVSSDTSYNQKHYEALGEIITEKVYQLLDEEGLQRLPVPPNSSRGSFVFATPDALSANKLLLLIHGTGVVRAGQWARSLIINDSLDSGTQIPYIRKGVELGYGVISFNTNDNYAIVEGKRVPKEGSGSPQEHANSVWRHYILPSKAQKIAIVAHSFGGVVTMSLASQFEADFLKRIFAIALTDSVHGRIPRVVSSLLADHLSKIGRNWISSGEPLDKLLPEHPGEIQCVSAGTGKHELTSWSSIGSVFNFIEDSFHSSVSQRDEL